MSEAERQDALTSFKAKLIESREWESKLKTLRLNIKDLQKEYDQTEDNIKALQSVGQIIGEVLKQLDEERCTPTHYRYTFTRANILPQSLSRPHRVPVMSSAAAPRSTKPSSSKALASLSI